MLVNAEVVAVYYAGEYPDSLAMQVLEEAGTLLVRKELPGPPRLGDPVPE
jgi:hypothetical protein